MKKGSFFLKFFFLKFFLTVVAFAALFSCDSVDLSGKNRDKLRIAVTIPPQAYIVKEIARDKARVTIMLQPASSPETYEPEPKKMAELKNTDVYFLIGVPFETASINKIKENCEGADFVDMREGATLREMETLRFRSAENGRGVRKIKDPHLWLDPLYLMIMAENSVKELVKKDPSNGDFYLKNYLALKEKIQKLYDFLLDLFAPYKGQAFVIYHPAWGYFADRFSLKQLPIEVEGKEPSAAEMAYVSEFIKKNGVKHILIQTPSSSVIVDSIAEESGAKITLIDPLKEDVLENIQKSALEIRKSLVKIQ